LEVDYAECKVLRQEFFNPSQYLNGAEGLADVFINSLRQSVFPVPFLPFGCQHQHVYVLQLRV
jgi:hypothetical protein